LVLNNITTPPHYTKELYNTFLQTFYSVFPDRGQTQAATCWTQCRKVQYSPHGVLLFISARLC